VGAIPTHILDRYLLREQLVFMGIGLAVAAALFVVIDLLQTLDRYIRIKPPIIYVIQHFLYRVPAALHDGPAGGDAGGDDLPVPGPHPLSRAHPR